MTAGPYFQDSTGVLRDLKHRGKVAMFADSATAEDRALMSASPNLLRALQKLLPEYRRVTGLVGAFDEDEFTVAAESAMVKASEVPL